VRDTRTGPDQRGLPRAPRRLPIGSRHRQHGLHPHQRHPGLKDQLISLATHYRHLNPSTGPETTLPETTLPETTLPVTQVGGAHGYYFGGAAIGDVEFPVQPADNQVIAAWDGSALPTPTAPASVVVDNLAGTYHLAASTAAALTAAGLHDR
jgi:hypothetical protein